MSRKFIFFKLFDNLNDSCENEILSLFEINSFYDDVEIIQNIFQLQQIPDLKLIINKSEDLQHLITQNLPGQGFRHGYLWSGEDPGNITDVLSGVALFRECFLFQKSTDPLPPGHSHAYFQLTKRLDVYNWYIFHLNTFQYFQGAANRIRHSAGTEIEIDRAFKRLWDESKSKELSEKAGSINRPDFSSEGPIHYSFLNLDKRAYVKNKDNRWIRAIINHLAPPHTFDEIFNPFCGTGDILTEIRLAGKTPIASDVNPVKVLYAESNEALFCISLEELNQGISSFVSQLKLLITSNEHTQTDLFLSSAEKQFNEFWISEKERIKAYKFAASINDNAKIIAAIRFLIDSKTISKSPRLNSIFLSALSNFISNLTRKSQKTDIISGFHRELRQLYLDIYTFQKIKQLSSATKLFSTITTEDAFSNRLTSGQKFNALLCQLPGGIKTSGFQNEQVILELLNPDANLTDLENAKAGNLNAVRANPSFFTDDLLNKGKMYSHLGPYAQTLITQFYNPKKENETAALLKQWIDYYNLLGKISLLLNEDGRACIIVKHLFLKIDEKIEEFKLSTVLKEMLEIHHNELNLDLDQVISKPVAYTHFGHLRHIHLLFLTKGSRTDSDTENNQ